MAELVSTEERYVFDLQAVLEGYRNKLDQTYLTAKTGGFNIINNKLLFEVLKIFLNKSKS